MIGSALNSGGTVRTMRPMTWTLPSRPGSGNASAQRMPMSIGAAVWTNTPDGERSRV